MHVRMYVYVYACIQDTIENQHCLLTDVVISPVKITIL